MSRKEAGMGISVRITTATTTVVKATPGMLYRIIIGTTAAGAITVNDGAAVIAVLKASISEGSYALGVHFRTSLSIVTAAASDITVVYE
jgi:hypothetical protein